MGKSTTETWNKTFKNMVNHRVKYLIAFIVTLYCVNLYAQESSLAKNDSVKYSISLKEVTVEAKRREMKGDTLCVFPTSNQRKVTQTGFELLRSVMLPGLTVNAVKGELAMNDGMTVTTLIDGRPVTKQDLLALRPKEVKRIEYIQNPGAEYSFDSSVGAVINFVMKERTDGTAVGVITNNAVTTFYGQNFGYAKYNHSNSEFAVSVESEYTSLKKRRINDYDRYLIDNAWHDISRRGLNTPLKFTENTLQLSYNYFIPHKVIFDVTAKGLFYHSPSRAHRQLVSEAGTRDYYQETKPYEKFISPSINLYYKRYLNSKSAITANLVGIMRNTDYKYHMSESYASDFSDPFSSYGYESDGKRQSYISEIKYFNMFSHKIGLNTGTRVSYSNTINKYYTDSPKTDQLHDTNIYAFIAAYGYLKNGSLSYYLGAGVSGRILRQNGLSSSEWILRPEFQLAYSLKNWRLTLTGRLSQESPSLSQMTDTELRINDLETKAGNPDLKDWWKYKFTFRLNGNLGPMGIQNSLSYSNAHNPVMEQVRREADNIFVFTYENQRRMTNVSDNLTLYMNLSKDITLSSGASYNLFQARGNNYRHNLHVWNFNISADWAHNNWNVGMNWKSKDKTLHGESYSTTGAYNNVYVNYTIGQFRVGIVGQHLFCKKGPTFSDHTVSQYLQKDQTVMVPSQGNMIMVSLTWNLSKGKQRKEATIDLNNDDNESGILKY